ncbi:MAG: carotenoid biosynthesis protein [Pseudomonadota bacterium]
MKTEMEIPVLFLKTVALRPYVFVFMGAFLFAAIVSIGLRRTLVFMFGTWVVAFLSEICSTRTGFPYGLYHYTESTRGEELFLSNVPFMDSLSFTFLLFASFSTALFFLSPLKVSRRDVQIADTFAIRRSWKTLVLTALFMMLIDFVIDPVALRGDRWFLGRIYFYDKPGAYFGVPLSNALGWGLVGFVATWIYQRIEGNWLGAGFRDSGIRILPFQGLYGLGLYFGVLAFNLFMTGWIGERGLLIAGIFLYLLPITLLIFRWSDPRVRATEDEWSEHLRDFGFSSSKDKIG